MSRSLQIQSNFTVGEIDPLLRSRIDLSQYYAALQQCRNATVQPQGGVTRRPGLEYITTIPSGDSPQDGVKLMSFHFSQTDTYVILAANNKFFFFRNGALVTNINSSGNDYLTSGIASASLSSLDYTQSADTMILVQEDMAPRKLVRGAGHNLWTISTITFDSIPQHAFTISESTPSATLTPSATSGNITLTASASAFASGNVGDYCYANDGFGRARIIGFTSATVVSAVTEIPFFSTSAIAASSWTLEAGYEDAWSGSRGYPRTVTFHQGRLVFGGGKSQPATIWMSRVNQFFDFNVGQGLDDEAIVASVDTQDLNAIVGIHSGRDLQIFTTAAEFAIPQTDLEPITPGNIAVRRQTTAGAKAGIRTIGSDNGTLFIQREGKSLREFLFQDVAGAYTSNNISLLSSHLLSTPTDMALRKATSTTEGDLLVIVNSSDGSLAAFSFLRPQNVIAPALWTTTGEFIAVTVDVDEIYAVVKRTINGSTVYYVERFNSDYTTDATTRTTPAAYGSPLVRGASQTGTSLEIDALTHQPQPDDTFTVAGVSGSYQIKSATAFTDDGSGSTKKSTLTLTGDLASSPADNAAVTFTSVGQVRDLTHLEAASCKVIADNVVLGDETVSSGVITADRPGSTFIDVGLDYTLTVQTMPVETNLSSGNIQSFKKRVVDVTALLYQTQNLKINNVELAFRRFDNATFDGAFESFTGAKRTGPLFGWDREATITVTQTNPLFMTLLGLSYKVSVSQ